MSFKISPLASPGPSFNKTESVGHAVQHMISRAMGPRVKAGTFADEEQLLWKTRSFRLKGEDRIMQFVARTGISPNEIRMLSSGELSHRVELANERIKNEVARGLHSFNKNSEFSLVSEPKRSERPVVVVG